MTDHSIIIRPFDKITDTDTLVEIWLRASLQAHALWVTMAVTNRRAPANLH